METLPSDMHTLATNMPVIVRRYGPFDVPRTILQRCRIGLQSLDVLRTTDSVIGFFSNVDFQERSFRNSACCIPNRIPPLISGHAIPRFAECTGISGASSAEGLQLAV